MKKIVLAFAFLASGCGASLRPDAVISSFDANYPEAEFYACGQHFKGLGVCEINAGTDLSSIAATVATYYSGSVEIVSNDCGLNSVVEYQNSQPVVVPLSGPATKNCLISFDVAPAYPNQQSSGIVVRDFSGTLRVRVTDPHFKNWLSFESKVPVGNDGSITIPDAAAIHVPVNKAASTVQTVVEGCGISFDQQVPVVNGLLQLDLDLLKVATTMQTCVMDGFIATPGQPTVFTWIVAIYDDKYIPLPTPAATLSKTTLSVLADSNVSVLGLDGTLKVADQTSFSFDPTLPHTLRALTVAGRSAIGDWNPKTGAWTWLP